MDSVHVNHKNDIRSPKPLGVGEQVVIKRPLITTSMKKRPVFDKDVGKGASIIEWEVDGESGLVIYKVMVKESADIKAYFPEDLIFIN